MGSGNGRANAEISASDWISLNRRVDDLDEAIPQLGALMGEIGRTRQAAEAAKSFAQKAVDQVAELTTEVHELTSWKDDSKVQQIVDLKKHVGLLESREDARREEIARDRLDLKRSARAALVSAIITALVGIAVHRLTSPTTPQATVQSR